MSTKQSDWKAEIDFRLALFRLSSAVEHRGEAEQEAARELEALMARARSSDE